MSAKFHYRLVMKCTIVYIRLSYLVYWTQMNITIVIDIQMSNAANHFWTIMQTIVRLTRIYRLLAITCFSVPLQKTVVFMIEKECMPSTVKERFKDMHPIRLGWTLKQRGCHQLTLAIFLPFLDFRVNIYFSVLWFHYEYRHHLNSVLSGEKTDLSEAHLYYYSVIKFVDTPI